MGIIPNHNEYAAAKVHIDPEQGATVLGHVSRFREHSRNLIEGLEGR